MSHSNRYTLHSNKLEEFLQFAEDQGWEREPINQRHGYEVARLIFPDPAGGATPVIFYRRATNERHRGELDPPVKGSDHITVPPRARDLLMAFIQSRRSNVVDLNLERKRRG